MTATPGRDVPHVGLSWWIIKDGNYPDFQFRVGEQVKFALESGSVRASDIGGCSARGGTTGP